ncbi:homoserine O-acetyltransferase MetX [Taibaiella chishuiensis]|uniref:Homoserine O-acetyltransferase n=1 Tax=Taibaiella chishuiensis TaxID=1434707 RepID=A0A2P8D0H6_9BACT|nr:homoserine O-acetyltransferase [Taibaiella chishuiensis]PSK90711.1 homoserine O-acetyltransferase [Taibaiella chishuiensis]
MQNSYHYDQAFTLENGGSLPELHISYHTYGQLDADKSNVVWICHALTASGDAAGWWDGLVGEGRTIDPARHFIVCANIIGSCYGSTGPLSIDKTTGAPFHNSFPLLTIRDMVQAHILLRRHLGIEEIHLLAGGSMGGYQAMEWALAEPQRIRNLFLLVTSAAESAWGIAIHTAQRLAISADQSFGTAADNAGAAGLKAARAIGMLTYRNPALMNKQQTDTDTSKTDDFKASTYIQYQGDKLVSRFNAYSYWTLTKAMDSHNLARGRAASAEAVLQQIAQPVLLVGISSDILCPPHEQRFLAQHLPLCRYEEIDSEYGHDGFLVESEQVGQRLQNWLEGLTGA